LIPEIRNFCIANFFMFIYWYFISSLLIYIHTKLKVKHERSYNKC
jgi:hypothetical protein